jgi:hypothetical protein
VCCFLTGKLADAESMVALKDLANRLGSGNIWHEGGFPEMSGGWWRDEGCQPHVVAAAVDAFY